jgi:hypothetical protein
MVSFERIAGARVALISFAVGWRAQIIFIHTATEGDTKTQEKCLFKQVPFPLRRRLPRREFPQGGKCRITKYRNLDRGNKHNEIDERDLLAWCG